MPILSLAWLLSGCGSTPTEPQVEVTMADVQIDPVPVKIDPALLQELLIKADAAIAADHLTFPQAGSAYDIFLQILAIEPDQNDARYGLQRIVEQYIELAMRALRRHQYATARSMLARARIILPDHPSIKPTAAQIRLISQALRTKLNLPQDDLDQGSDTISAELHALAQTPPAQSCRFIISAKNDAQGRWIYQTLAKGAASARIRAQIQIRLPAGVERLCFPA